MEAEAREALQVGKARGGLHGCCGMEAEVREALQVRKAHGGLLGRCGRKGECGMEFLACYGGAWEALWVRSAHTPCFQATPCVCLLQCMATQWRRG